MNRTCKVASIVLNDFRHDSRVLKEAVSLQTHGYDVTVVALHEEPLAEFETVANFKVHRIRLRSRALSKRFLSQALKYLEFLLRSAWRHRHSDVVHCHDLNALPVGVIVKLVLNRRARLVYDAHEYETEIEGLTGFRKRLCEVLERRLIRYADRVITVSPSIAAEYVRLYGIAEPLLVLNTPVAQAVARQDLLRDELGIPPGQRIVLMQGALSAGRGIEMLLEAAARRQAQDYAFVFMGYGSMEPVIRKAAEVQRNVYYQPAVPHDRILAYSASADVGVALIEDFGLSLRYCLPNKLFEYVMAGIPVVCSNLPEMRRFVEKYEVGVVAHELTADGVNDALDRVLRLDSRQLSDKLKGASELFNWQAQERVLTDAYREMLT